MTTPADDHYAICARNDASQPDANPTPIIICRGGLRQARIVAQYHHYEHRNAPVDALDIFHNGKLIETVYR